NALDALSKNKNFTWDSTSMKRIRFELSPDRSAIRKLEIAGLFKADDIKLQRFDAANLSKLEIRDDRTADVTLTGITAPAGRERRGEKEQSPSPVNWDTKD
ncbi:MAG TPA: hypothetical protein VH596_10565, partial [Terriglobales bacterium]